MKAKKRINQIVLFILSISIGYVSSGQVTVFSDRNFRSTSRVFTEPGDFRITFDIRSIRITPGYIVVLPEGSCNGKCQYWRSVSGDAVIGAQNCGLKIIRSDASDASIQIMIGTGGDDLRKGSTATLTITTNIPGGNRIISIEGAKEGLAGNSTRTFNLPITGLRIDQIINLSLSYESGSSGVPFETTDNWNVDQLIIVYRSSAYPDGLLLCNKSGSPLVRFTGSRQRFPILVRNSVCNDVLFDL